MPRGLRPRPATLDDTTLLNPSEGFWRVVSIASMRDASGVVLTVPLGKKRQLYISRTRGHGWSFTLWRERCEYRDDWPGDEPDAGVREPRRPLPCQGGGAIAL